MNGEKVVVDLKQHPHPISKLFGSLADAKIAIDRFSIWVAQVKPTVSGLSRLTKSLTDAGGKIAF